MGSPVKGNGTNWSAARAYYLALPPHKRSKVAVARRFGVTKNRVGQIAKRDGWDEAAVSVDEKVERRVEQTVARDRAERLRRTIRVYDQANDQALEKLDARQLEVKLADLPALFKMAELAAGEATDRVALSELQPVLVAFARIAVVNAAPDRRGDVLRDLEAASSGLVSLESAA